MDVENFMTWRAPCLECGTALKHGVGIFCANFLRRRGGFHPCMAAWCGACYKAYPSDPFPVQRGLNGELDEDEDLETEEKLATRFAQGRNGDYLMGIPFECDLCHFRNVAERDPVSGNAKDDFTLVCIRRACLDACWSRETSTVTGNLGRLQRDYYDTIGATSINNLLPPLGNRTIRDRVGMAVAAATLNATLRKGKYGDHLQWDTMRRTPTSLNNVYGAADDEETDDVYAGVDKKMYSSKAPTASKWFGRFMLGAKRRMGVHRRQDEALPVDQLMAVAELAESDWQKSVSEEEKKEIESVMAFVVVGFCLSLRGEEVPLIVIEGLLEFWDETMAHEVPHMMITLRGKFKGENNLRWHCVPLADITKSLIPTHRWVSRLPSRRICWKGIRA